MAEVLLVESFLKVRTSRRDNVSHHGTMDPPRFLQGPGVVDFDCRRNCHATGVHSSIAPRLFEQLVRILAPREDNMTPGRRCCGPYAFATLAFSSAALPWVSGSLTGCVVGHGKAFESTCLLVFLQCPEDWWGRIFS